MKEFELTPIIKKTPEVIEGKENIQPEQIISKVSLPLKSLDRHIQLSPRERQIIEMMQNSLEQYGRLPSHKEIAERLVPPISVQTVASFLETAQEKAGVSSILDLIFIDTKNSSEKQNQISLHLIPVPVGVSLTPEEINIVKKLREMLTQGHLFDLKELRFSRNMGYNSQISQTSRLLKKVGLKRVGLKSYIQLAFIDIDGYEEKLKGLTKN